MNIVSNNSFLRNLRNLEYFKMDLGTTRRNVNTGKFKKLSEFELKYSNLFNNNSLIKYGSIGKASFYEDMEIKEKMYYIFKDEEAYEIHYTDDDMLDFGDYVLSSMRKIDEAESEEDKETYSSTAEYIENGGEVWTSDDVKNGKKSYLVDQTLDKNEYQKQLLNKKRS